MKLQFQYTQYRDTKFLKIIHSSRVQSTKLKEQFKAEAVVESRDVGGASPSLGSSMHAKVSDTSRPGPYKSTSELQLLHGQGHGGPASEPA